jgi:hypothetical protein
MHLLRPLMDFHMLEPSLSTRCSRQRYSLNKDQTVRSLLDGIFARIDSLEHASGVYEDRSIGVRGRAVERYLPGMRRIPGVRFIQ